MNNKVATLIRIDEDIFDKIKELAESQKRSFNKQIEFILEKYIEEMEKESKD